MDFDGEHMLYVKDFDYIWNTLSSCAVVCNRHARHLYLIKRTDFTLNDARKVLHLISAPATSEHFGGKTRELTGFSASISGCSTHNGNETDKPAVQRANGANGDDRAILGRPSNQVCFFFFIHGYFLSIAFSPTVFTLG